MAEEHMGHETEKKRKVYHSKGVMYFNKDTERGIFFILTIIMLVWGVVAKIGF
ncbi:MAG: hypothetical protein K9M96_11875 [Deltaproteobacteria bacterium]|nr:hypothetical protein [Deltaproteobacteria bacterium]MCF8120701.1 hypothetical protein [Deltaproteobacteria bacterium]